MNRGCFTNMCHAREREHPKYDDATRLALRRFRRLPGSCLAHRGLHLRRQAFRLGWTPHLGRPEMTDLLQGLTLLPADGAPSGPVDVRFQDGLIAAIGASPRPPSRRLLVMPALVNAHDHARPLSPSSFGAAGKPLETWLLRLGAMPGVDPYLAAVAAFGRAARGGAGSVMAHYTRLHGPMPPIEEMRDIARAARDVGVRVTLALFMRDRNPLVYGAPDAVLGALDPAGRAAVEAAFLSALPGPAEQVARVEAIAAELESPAFTV